MKNRTFVTFFCLSFLYFVLLLLLFTSCAHQYQNRVTYNKERQFTTFAQPMPPKDRVSHPDISPEVQKEVLKLYSQDPVERGYGAFYLGEMGSQATAAVPFLIALLNDNTPLAWWPHGRTPSWSNTSPAKEAVEALGKIGDKRAFEPLFELLKRSTVNSPYCTFGIKVVEALGRIHDDRAVEPLIEAFHIHKSPVDLKAAVVTALGNIRNIKAIETLLEALKDKHLFIKHEASEALTKITGKKFGEDIVQWQLWWRENKAK